MLGKSTISKLNSVFKKLSREALQLAHDSKIGMSIGYEVAKATDDPEQQLAWLKEHAAGRMSREEIIDAGKPKPEVSKTVNVQLTIEGVTVKITMPSSVSYDQIGEVLTKLKKRFSEQKQMDHPIALLPQLMTKGA